MTEYIEVKIDIFDYLGQRAKIRTDISVDTLIHEILKEFDDLDRKTPEAYALFLKGMAKPFDREQAVANLDLQANDELELKYARVSARGNIDEAPAAYFEELSTHRKFTITWQPAVIGRKSLDLTHSELLAIDLSYHPLSNRVSRRNAQVTIDDQGYSIEPLSPNNPIYILGDSEPVREKRLLKPLDEVALAMGNIILKFNLGNPEESSPELPHARLTLLNTSIAELQGKTFNITKDEILIGRLDCDITFANDTKISRKHARVSYLPDQKAFYVIDLGSANGVYVRENIIPPDTPTVLNNGDVIGIGPETRLVFEVEP